MLGHGLALADVDGDVARVDALLDLAHLGMLSAPTEQPRRLHTEVAHLAGVSSRSPAGGLCWGELCCVRGLWRQQVLRWMREVWRQQGLGRVRELQQQQELGSRATLGKLWLWARVASA